MSHSKLLAAVVLIKLSLLYITLASCLTSYNDAHNHNQVKFNQPIRRRRLPQPVLAHGGPGPDYSRDAATLGAVARLLGASITTKAPPADLATVNNPPAVRDNKIDDLFFDQHTSATQATARVVSKFKESPQTDDEKPSEVATSSLSSSFMTPEPKLSLYNTINLDNSIEEPEMFTNNHQSSQTIHLTPESLASGGGPSSLAASSSVSATPSSVSYNPRHYHQLNSMKGQSHHQHHPYHTQSGHQLNTYGNQFPNHNYGKYPSNMFANNYNLNYIHSFLTNKPPSSPQPPLTNLLNMPDLLNSNPNRLTLGAYGGFTSAYISASSALSAAVNNIQSSMNQKQQQTLSAVDPPQPDQLPSTQAVNASIGDLPGSSMCGRQQVAYREPRVVGGNNTYEGEFPWAVSIQRHGNHHCGGVIVGKRWILTAAHCVRSQLVGNLVVRTGGHTLSRSPNSLNGHMEKDYQVEQIVMHDDFSRYDNLTISHSKSSANTNNADIALLKLKHEIHWNELAWPVCFPNSEAGNFSGHDATVIGWGKLNEKSEEFSNELQKVKLTIIDNKVCQNWFRQAGRDMPIDDRIICAGFKSGGKDACHGDSGGPLLSRINGQYVVVGVVSTGIGCARPLLPGLYSRVSSYIDWIERYITS